MNKITCVVDNSVKQASALWGEHGLAFCFETEAGRVLFDTGQSGTILSHNLVQLGEADRRLDGLILSHAHYDHTGGLPAVLAGQPGLPIYASPDLFRPRYDRRPDGRCESIGLKLSRAELAVQADLRLNTEPVQVLPGLWTTGEIAARPEPEGRSPRHFVPDGAGWQPDPYRDDISMVLETGAGLVVVCGCCHAGLLNTLAHVRRLFQQPITTIVGGTHLVSADAAQLAHVIAVLRQEYGGLDFYLNHCTGEQAFVSLAEAFGQRVQPCRAGTVLTFA